MNKKIIGAVLIIAGVAAIVWGYNIYDSTGAQITRTLSGDTPVNAWIGMVGGAISVALGIFGISKK